ncbi:deoxyribodipyrimidine photo-lyase [Kamptonema cortianum]|nr:deoxyribodipyrimidine photo-lyase [Kamptonema cortianum]
MNPSEPVVIHWFRRDLRLSDNLALHAAAATGRRVMPVFIFDPTLLRGERFSPARLMFMLRTLASLQDAIRQRGGKLVIRHGAPEMVLPQLVETSAAEAVYANRDYSSYAVRRDEQLAADLPVSLHLFDDALIHPPEQVQTHDGRPFVVFTPFKRQWLTLPKPLSATSEGAALRFADAGEDAGALPTLEDLGVKATFDVPEVGEKHAQDMLETFAAGAIDQYGERRDHLLIDPFHRLRRAGHRGCPLTCVLVRCRRAWRITRRCGGAQKPSLRRRGLRSIPGSVNSSGVSSTCISCITFRM